MMASNSALRASLCLDELENDIAESLRLEELRKMPNLELMECQNEITWEMRHQLLEFLAEVQTALGLSLDSWGLAVSILDRYMSQRYVYAKLFQLLGCVCLWIAAKSCDDKKHIPTTGTLSYICGNIYPEAMFNEMELHILSSLEWNITAPTVFDFINHSVKKVGRELIYNNAVIQDDDLTAIYEMACYVSECALYTSTTLGYRPSEISASAVSLSTLVLDETNNYKWPMANAEHCSKECFDALVAVITNPPVRSVQRYSSTSKFSVPIRFDRFISKMSSILEDEIPLTPYSDTSSTWDADSISTSSPEVYANKYGFRTSPRTPVDLTNSNKNQAFHVLKGVNVPQYTYDDEYGHSVSGF